MIKLLYGDEPYLIKQTLDEAKESVSCQEMNFLYTEAFDTDTYTYVCQYPFLESKKVCHLHLSSSASNSLLEEYIENPSNTCDLFITIESLDKRSKLFKLLKNQVCECKKLPCTDVKNLIRATLKEYNSSIDNEVLNFLYLRMGYETADINLFSVLNITKQLAMSASIVTKELIVAMVEETKEEKAFSLFSYIATGESTKSFSLLKNLYAAGEQPIAVLSLLLRSYRIAYKIKSGGTGDKLGLNAYQMRLPEQIKRLKRQELVYCMNLIQQAVNNIKMGENATNISIALIGKLLSFSS